jgi:hypothetical protein
MSHGRLVAELPGDIERSALLDAISATPGVATRSLQ